MKGRECSVADVEMLCADGTVSVSHWSLSLAPCGSLTAQWSGVGVVGGWPSAAESSRGAAELSGREACWSGHVCRVSVLASAVR